MIAHERIEYIARFMHEHTHVCIFAYSCAYVRTCKHTHRVTHTYIHTRTREEGKEVTL